MGKSRPRPADTKIIDRPELKTPIRNSIEGITTIFLWAIWIYFIIPAVTALLWIVGIRHSWIVLYEGAGFSQLLWLLRSAGVIILAIFILDMTWMKLSNYLHYRIKLKKLPPRPACLESELSWVFGIDPVEVVKAKQSNRICLVLKDNKVTITSA